MKTNIALIGFMGVGKTVVGQLLAKKLARKFLELDLLIEQKAGKPIPEIFRQDGEITFRELEIAAAKEVASEKDVVIACGGGIVLNKINIDRLREFIFNSSFIKRYQIKTEVLKEIKADDVALMKFGFEWVKFFVWGMRSKKIQLR